MSILANKHNDTRVGQAGMASILVTMVLMIVISLIVLGFAQVSRRNQREALDNQLSNQAFYAAETGVNDYSKIVKDYISMHSLVVSTDIAQNTCTPAPSSKYSGLVGSTILSTSPDVSYTCVLVDATPTSLQYGSVGNTSLIIPINASDASGNTKIVNSLTLAWQTTLTNPITPPADGCYPNPSKGLSTIDTFPTSGVWAATKCGFGILRIDLVPTNGNLSLQGLQATTMTALLVPTNTNAGVSNPAIVNYSAGTNQYGANANQGAVVAAKCDNSTGCSVTIKGLNSANYYLRINSIYETASIKVIGYNDTMGSTPLSLGAQILIDSTGKAQDILRRIQVRIPVSANANISTFDSAIQSSQSLCKQFQTAPPDIYFNTVGC